MADTRVLGCRLSEAEWQDFYNFRKDVLPEQSSTAALRVLLQLALTVTGHARDLWTGTQHYVPDGWFSNTAIAAAKAADSAAGNGRKAGKKAGKKPGKKAVKAPVANGGEA